MTQLGEAVAIGVMSEADVPCPLDHDDIQPIKSENNFVGDGGVLGRNMENAKSSITYGPNQSGKPGARQYPTSSADTDWPVTVDGHAYPVTCAAHHLIPAQASLKKATALHKWMVYKKKPEPVGGAGGGSVSGSVWADVGYDVNGVENGVWLPGNYAVGGAGTGDWTSAPSALDNESSSAKKAPAAPADSTKLSGLRHNFDTDNRKGQYVAGATYVFNAQFHDSHGNYSLLVTSMLDKIAQKYQELKLDIQPSCSKCKQRRDKAADEGIPTHFGLAHRLNSVSDRLSRYLIGRRGHPEVYTSDWGRAAHMQGMHLVSSYAPPILES
ncbi:MAG: AHH domain-containing protein [Rubrivivax sp.]|nr:AHH domain-containing protein [Rubrivivax sp.]